VLSGHLLHQSFQVTRSRMMNSGIGWVIISLCSLVVVAVRYAMRRRLSLDGLAQFVHPRLTCAGKQVLAFLFAFAVDCPSVVIVWMLLCQ